VSSTRPSWSIVIVCPARGTVIEPVAANVRAAGS
jgi:hypothetical protein